MIRCNSFLSSYELVKCQLKPCFLLKNENTYCWKVKLMPIKLPGVEHRRVVGVLPPILIWKILIWNIPIWKISFEKISFEKILIWKILIWNIPIWKILFKKISLEKFYLKKFSFEKVLIWKFQSVFDSPLPDTKDHIYKFANRSRQTMFRFTNI